MTWLVVQIREKLIVWKDRANSGYKDSSTTAEATRTTRMSTNTKQPTVKALVLVPSTATASVQDVPVPVPGPGEVLIRVRAVAVNPVDQFYHAHPIAAQEKRVMGVDFAGEVARWHEDLNSSLDQRVREMATGRF